MAVSYVSERTIPSSKIPPLHLDRVEMQIADKHVAGPRSIIHWATRIRGRVAVMELIAAAVGQGECGAALADIGQIARQIGQAVSDEMHQLASR